MLLAIVVDAATPPPNICTNRRVGSFVRDVRNCRGYFFCSPNGTAEHHQCGDEWHFDEPRQMCNFPSMVDCFNCPPNGQFANLPVVGMCNQYIRCMGGVPQHRLCPGDLLFDRDRQQCNVAASVTCTQVVPQRCPLNSNRPVFFRDEADCSRWVARILVVPFVSGVQFIHKSQSIQVHNLRGRYARGA